MELQERATTKAKNKAEDERQVKHEAKFTEHGLTEVPSGVSTVYL
jgi:hypothetical protein